MSNDYMIFKHGEDIVCRYKQMYLWLDTERGMEFRRQVPVRLSQPPWNNDEALSRNISVFHCLFVVIVVVVIIIIIIKALCEILVSNWKSACTAGTEIPASHIPQWDSRGNGD